LDVFLHERILQHIMSLNKKHKPSLLVVVVVRCELEQECLKIGELPPHHQGIVSFYFSRIPTHLRRKDSSREWLLGYDL
jgi:hypothetical protein